MKPFVGAYEFLMRMLFDMAVKSLIKLIGIAMVAAILLQILARISIVSAYLRVLGVPFDWTDEMARGAFVWYCLLGSALGTRQYAHLGIDYFRSKLGERGQWLSDLAAAIAVTVFGTFVAYLGWRFLRIVGIQKTPIMRISMQWFYLAVPLSGTLIFLQGTEFAISYLTTGKGRPPPEEAAPPPGSEAFLESSQE